MNKTWIIILSILAILIILGIVFFSIGKCNNSYKTFAANPDVISKRVYFKNRFDIKIAADMYMPKNMDRNNTRPAIVVAPPYGGVKEQAAGLYAQEMAARGFVTLAIDPSFNGDSGGTPRHTSSPEIFVEDINAAVDFLGTRPFVDRNEIGVIGICGSGSFALNAAAIDPRIKAVATISMYDISRNKARGFKDSMTDLERQAYLKQLGEQRWADFENGNKKLSGRGAPETIDENTDPIGVEFYEYYSTKRGGHPNSITQFTLSSDVGFMNFPLVTYVAEISPRPVLLIMGETAHSRYFSEDIYKMLQMPKELYIVPNAGHVDLYDKMNLIPFDKLEDFFKKSL